MSALTVSPPPDRQPGGWSGAALPPPRVTVAADQLVRVQAHGANAPGLLARLGFDADGGGEYTARVHDTPDEARLFAALRDQGRVTGPFRSIVWQGPAVRVARDE